MSVLSEFQGIKGMRLGSTIFSDFKLAVRFA